MLKVFKTVAITAVILFTIIIFIQLSDLKYRPLVVLKSNKKLNNFPCKNENEVIQMRLNWGKIEHPGWENVIYSHIISKIDRNHVGRSTARLWVQHPYRFAKQLYHTIMQHENPYWKEFDSLGPVTPSVCPNLITVGYTKDEEKKLCWNESVFKNPNCVIFSLGSNNQWSFEEDMLQKTECRIFTFDCTIKKPETPLLSNKRLSFHPYCVGAMDVVDGTTGWRFMLLPDLMKHVAHVEKIDYLKMDVEGYEFESLVPFLSEHKSLRPQQIAVEIHYQSSKFDLDENALLAFGNFMFYEAGYLIAHRRDNILGYFASEILFIKIQNC